MNGIDPTDQGERAGRARWRRAVGEVVAYVRELLPDWRPRPSHVSAAAAQPPPLPLSPPSPWGAAWTTPTPAHVRERHAPLRGEDVALVRPYVVAEERRQREAVRRELADAVATRRLYVLA